MKRTFLILSAICLGSVHATTYPLTLKDDVGRLVTLKAEPKRIVSMLPSDTEILCAIGVCDRVVGVDDYSNFPKEVLQKSKVGNLFEPNIEAIMALKPDLVVVSKYGKLMEPLERLGLTVVALHPEQYGEVFQKTTLLGKMVNRESEAKQLNLGIQSKIKLLELKVRGLPKPTVYFEIDPTPYTVGPNSFMGVILGKAGASNIVPENLGDFPQISVEWVFQKDPQVILGMSLQEAKKRSGWDKISAVKQAKVFEIPAALNDMLVRPGPRMAEGLEGLIAILHPRQVRP
ncbi:MAG: ABC transporter substrate-binding protein [Deinococcaceae bacterium]